MLAKLRHLQEWTWFLKNLLKFLICKVKEKTTKISPSCHTPWSVRIPAPGPCQFTCSYRGAYAQKRCEACCFHSRLCFPGRPWSEARLHESSTRAPSRAVAFPGSTCQPHTGLPHRPGYGNASLQPA